MLTKLHYDFGNHCGMIAKVLVRWVAYTVRGLILGHSPLIATHLSTFLCFKILVFRFHNRRHLLQEHRYLNEAKMDQ